MMVPAPQQEASTPAERRSVIEAALLAYQARIGDELLNNFKAWPTTSRFNPICCDRCRERHVQWQRDEDRRLRLLHTLRTTGDALADVRVASHFGRDA